MQINNSTEMREKQQEDFIQECLKDELEKLQRNLLQKLQNKKDLAGESKPQKEEDENLSQLKVSDNLPNQHTT